MDQWGRDNGNKLLTGQQALNVVQGENEKTEVGESLEKKGKVPDIRMPEGRQGRLPVNEDTPTPYGVAYF